MKLFKKIFNAISGSSHSKTLNNIQHFDLKVTHAKNIIADSYLDSVGIFDMKLTVNDLSSTFFISFKRGRIYFSDMEGNDKSLSSLLFKIVNMQEDVFIFHGIDNWDAEGNPKTLSDQFRKYLSDLSLMFSAQGILLTDKDAVNLIEEFQRKLTLLSFVDLFHDPNVLQIGSLEEINNLPPKRDHFFSLSNFQ